MTGMPVQDGVAVFEGSGLSHEHFPAAALFRRASVKANRAFDFSGLNLLGNGDGGRRGRGSKKMMPAAVTVPTFFGRFAIRHRVLRKSRQSVELTQDPDHRLSAANRRRKCGRDPADFGLDGKARRFQHFPQRR